MADILKTHLTTITPRQHPIIYVRGYAMTEGERDETTVDPFCGFNLGSTVYRASSDKNEKARKFVFESPMVRLMSDFKYTDVYENGLDIVDDGWVGKIPYQSVIIFRYYEQGSGVLGGGDSSPIEQYAKDLGKLIGKVRDLVVDETGHGIADFKCYLVAHSMGGLICRAFLQNPALGDDTARSWVDKVFTYATPHNGIETAGINIPSWLSVDDMNNFNRSRMAQYLGLEDDPEYLAPQNDRVDFLRNFSPDRFFCMVGTNRADYNVAAGLSRTFAGHGSDGLVKVDNAVLYGQKNGATVACPRAYAYRSHSGFFGIVNSEEAFQNLTRFLFGDFRIDIWFDVTSVVLPAELQQKAEDVQADYLFELSASPKGKPWYLTRRKAEEDSVAVRSHKELAAAGTQAIYLSSMYLANWAKVDATSNQLSYSVTTGIRVQDYLVKGFLFDSHYEGLKLFSDTLVVTIDPGIQVAWRWGQDPSEGAQSFSPEQLAELENGRSISLSIDIPTAPGKAPGITGRLRFIVTPWNRSNA